MVKSRWHKTSSHWPVRPETRHANRICPESRQPSPALTQETPRNPVGYYLIDKAVGNWKGRWTYRAMAGTAVDWMLAYARAVYFGVSLWCKPHCRRAYFTARCTWRAPKCRHLILAALAALVPASAAGVGIVHRQSPGWRATSLAQTPLPGRDPKRLRLRL